MKSPYQISKEIGVSPQAVYKRLTSQFNNQFNSHIEHNKRGKYLLDEVAEKALKALFSQVVQPVQQSTIEPVEHPLLNQLNTENSFLKTRIETLEGELKTERIHSREQMDKLSDLAQQLADLNRNNQILLGAEQNKTNSALIMESDQPKQDKELPLKKGFFKRLFNK